jgi:hypothetical protein
VVIGLAFVSLVACAGGSADGRPTPTVALTEPPAPTPDDVLPAGDPGVTVANAVLACREKDGDRLGSFVAGAVTEEEIQALFGRGSDVRLFSQTVPHAEDGRATVTVRLSVRRDGETELVERTWELEQGADGVWRFTALPDCF